MVDPDAEAKINEALYESSDEKILVRENQIDNAVNMEPEFMDYSGVVSN